MKQTITLTCDEVFKAAKEYVQRRGWKVVKTRMCCYISRDGDFGKRCCKVGDYCLHIAIDVEPEQPDGTPYRGALAEADPDRAR